MSTALDIIILEDTAKMKRRLIIGLCVLLLLIMIPSVLATKMVKISDPKVWICDNYPACSSYSLAGTVDIGGTVYFDIPQDARFFYTFDFENTGDEDLADLWYRISQGHLSMIHNLADTAVIGATNKFGLPLESPTINDIPSVVTGFTYPSCDYRGNLLINLQGATRDSSGISGIPVNYPGSSDCIDGLTWTDFKWIPECPACYKLEDQDPISSQYFFENNAGVDLTSASNHQLIYVVKIGGATDSLTESICSYSGSLDLNSGSRSDFIVPSSIPSTCLLDGTTRQNSAATFYIGQEDPEWRILPIQDVPAGDVWMQIGASSIVNTINIYSDKIGYIPNQIVKPLFLLRVAPINAQNPGAQPLPADLKLIFKVSYPGIPEPVFTWIKTINPGSILEPGTCIGSFPTGDPILSPICDGFDYIDLNEFYPESPIEFNVGPEVPELFNFYFTSDPVAEPNWPQVDHFSQQVNLIKSTLCDITAHADSTGDWVDATSTGCDCEFMRSGDLDSYQCTITEDDFNVNSLYYMAFKFNQNDPNAFFNLQEVQVDGITKSGTNSEDDLVYFTSVPNPTVSPDNKIYKIIFDRDVDSDGYEDPAFGGDDCWDNSNTDDSICTGITGPSDCDPMDNTYAECAYCIYPDARAEICDDGYDNDCDGNVDCSDSECSANPLCEPVPDCGLAIFENTLYNSRTRPIDVLRLDWSKQSSIFPVTYKLSYLKDGTSSWVDIISTNAIVYNWNLPGEGIDYGSYTLRLIPEITLPDGRKVEGTENRTRVHIGENGVITGTVYCGLDPVEGVIVRAIQGSYLAESAETNAQGKYTITEAPVGYNTRIDASAEGRKTQSLTYDIDPAADPAEAVVDFDDVCPITLDCEADCTLKDGDICIADCNGYIDNSDPLNPQTCSLNPACYNVKKGLRLPGSDDYHEMVCCEGNVIKVSKLATKVDIDAEDISRSTRIVYYQGKPVKMIIVAWE